MTKQAIAVADDWELDRRRRDLAVTWNLVPRRLVGKPIDPALRSAVDGWRGESLILCGETGAGKTAACVALVQRLCRDGVAQGGKAFDLARSTYWVLGDDLRSAGGTHHDESAAHMIRRARDCRLLILDDIPQEPGKTITSTLKVREARGLPTVATTGDLTADELLKRVGGLAVLRWILEATEPIGRVVGIDFGESQWRSPESETVVRQPSQVTCLLAGVGRQVL